MSSALKLRSGQKRVAGPWAIPPSASHSQVMMDERGSCPQPKVPSAKVTVTSFITPHRTWYWFPRGRRLRSSFSLHSEVISIGQAPCGWQRVRGAVRREVRRLSSGSVTSVVVRLAVRMSALVSVSDAPAQVPASAVSFSNCGLETWPGAIQITGGLGGAGSCPGITVSRSPTGTGTGTSGPRWCARRPQCSGCPLELTKSTLPRSPSVRSPLESVRNSQIASRRCCADRVVVVKVVNHPRSSSRCSPNVRRCIHHRAVGPGGPSRGSPVSRLSSNQMVLNIFARCHLAVVAFRRRMSRRSWHPHLRSGPIGSWRPRRTRTRLVGFQPLAPWRSSLPPRTGRRRRPVRCRRSSDDGLACVSQVSSSKGSSSHSTSPQVTSASTGDSSMV